ncbi:MAG TPA: hypothetical protein VGH42_08050 [Verrucomicrobiae bacterium]|jgi:hypothetical protein
MKKIIQRKGLVGLAILGTFVIWMGCRCGWDGYTHHGKGTWTFGGDESGTGGALGSDEYQDTIPEDQYKRESYINAVTFFIIGGLMLQHAIVKWRERNELEKSWKRMLENTKAMDELHQKPELYRDDFKQWIKENHPHLAFWELPPNSSN